ncbi:MAG: hypothetical protein RLY89_832 [Bacteroidota bacterium]|jgi:uncharacterized protein YhbP (UPF0306 family)
MNPSISEFLLSQSCANIACLDNAGKPYSFSCYYVFHPELNQLYFKSSVDAAHFGFLVNSSAVSGTVLPDILNKLMVKGLQMEGICLNEDHPLAKGASQYYHKKNPLALAMSGKVWTIQIEHLKLTDSSFGFGKKLHWYAQSGQAE